MREPRSDGLRILLSYQPSFWFMDIANVLRHEFSSQGYTEIIFYCCPIIHYCCNELMVFYYQF